MLIGFLLYSNWNEQRAFVANATRFRKLVSQGLGGLCSRRSFSSGLEMSGKRCHGHVVIASRVFTGIENPP